jgi:pimeloyl-ACP methyl ester carboxylesterase
VSRATHSAVGADGRERVGVVALPSSAPTAVAIVFHPFGFDTTAVLDGEPPGERLIRPLEGVAAAAELHRLAVVTVEGRGRALEAAPLAWPAHLDFAWALAKDVAAAAGVERIVTGGLSMGGLEALVLAGRHPGEVQAVWAANPVVDPAQWHEDVSAGEAVEPDPAGVPRLLEDEIGSAPDQDHAAWSERSALNYVDGLLQARVQLVWSPADSVVPDQAAHHAGRLARELRRRGADIDERVVTQIPADVRVDAGRYAHESCDVWSGLAFLSDRDR